MGSNAVAMAPTTDEPPLTSNTFIAALVAALVLSGRTAIKPKTAADQQAFFDVYELVAKEAQKLKDTQPASTPIYREMVRLRNAIAPSSTGSFDGFEHLLRDQQLWLTACANPFYEEISFEIPPPYAASILNRTDELVRNLAEDAARCFTSKK